MNIPINPRTGKLNQAHLGKALGIREKAMAYFVRKGMPNNSYEEAKAWLDERRKMFPQHLNKFDSKNPDPNHPRIRLIPQVREMLGRGMSITNISKELQVSTHTVQCIAVENNIHYDPAICNVMAEQPWQVGDPKTLNDDQREMCDTFSIKPERMAWLITCPKGGQPTRL